MEMLYNMIIMINSGKSFIEINVQKCGVALCTSKVK